MINMDLKKAASIMAKAAGKATLAKYGKEHYTKMVNKRWANARAKRVIYEAKSART